jgi:hypothetical protein
MIAYCPLEELEPPPRQQVVVEQPPIKEMGDEDTELNYVIIAFIVGVIMLAISDSIRA